MTTLDKLQQLNDAQFHRLADAILRRLEPRYHLLRPHGVNSTGQSIKGQPDSYVGTSARACTIAFCYTTVKARWWDKVVADIREAISTSPLVEEIVAAIPRNADREGPGKVIPWEAQAKEAAGTARFTFFDGPKLAHLLDADYQDIRYEFLSIPFSRLSKSALIASCRAANQNALDDLLAKGRYSREQYVRRQADAELRTLWAEAFRSACDATGRAGGCLIPVLGDSGLGKTSLLCSFVESRT